MRKKPWVVATLALVAIVVAAGFWIYMQALPTVNDLPVLQGQLSRHQLSHEGRERSYLLYAPPQRLDPAPVVFVFHGSVSSGESMRYLSAYQFDRIADSEGFLVVYPDGYDRHWNDCRGTASYRANTENVDDVGFVRSMLNDLAAQYAIDRRRVFATGLSNGGHMALRLALEAPDLVRAVAPMAASLPAPDYLDCTKSGRAVSIAIVNGTRDPVNPYEGGPVKILWDDSRGVVESTPATAKYFARLAGYGGTGDEVLLEDAVEDDGSHIQLQRWHGRDREVRLYKVVGGGHTFPTRHTRFGALLGGDNADLEIAEELWEFFRRQ